MVGGTSLSYWTAWSVLILGTNSSAQILHQDIFAAHFGTLHSNCHFKLPLKLLLNSGLHCDLRFFFQNFFNLFFSVCQCLNVFFIVLLGTRIRKQNILAIFGVLCSLNVLIRDVFFISKGTSITSPPKLLSLFMHHVKCGAVPL